MLATSTQPVISTSYDPVVVTLSVLIAISASYAALDLAGRVTAAHGWIRSAWTGGGAMAMGIGIWSMHFTGMLAFHLSVPTQYHWPTVLAAVAVSTLSSAFALYVASRKTVGWMYLFCSALAMGVGISGLHYICMAAMRFTGTIQYKPLIVALAVLFAIGFSFIALWLAFHFRGGPQGVGWRKIGSAAAMGAAISVMHYTGMASGVFVRSAIPPDLSRSVGISTLGTAGITAVTLLVLGIAMFSSMIDRRLHTQALDLALEQTKAELARMARIATVGELAASIAHEINQPLTAVVTNAGASLRWLALQPPNLDEAREAAKRTVREANRASEVIANIRALVRKQPTRAEQLHINEVIEQGLALTRQERARAAVRTRTHLGTDLPPLSGDRVQLQQMMLNLILNAIDAMAETTEEWRKLSITSASVPEGILIDVQDFGRGVDLQDADRIFEPFFSTKPQGIGMGLSISRTIIEAHGGRLWVTSGVPRGTIFHIILPRTNART